MNYFATSIQYYFIGHGDASPHLYRITYAAAILLLNASQQGHCRFHAEACLSSRLQHDDDITLFFIFINTHAITVTPRHA